MTKVFGWGTRVGLATRPSLVLPVDIHEKEQAEGNHGEKGLEEVTSYYDQTLAKAVETGDCQEHHHDCLCCCCVAQDDPL